MRPCSRVTRQMIYSCTVQFILNRRIALVRQKNHDYSGRRFPAWVAHKLFTRTRTTPCPVNMRPPPYSPRPAEQNKTLRSSLTRTFRAMFARGDVCAVCRCLVVHQSAFVRLLFSLSLSLFLSRSLFLFLSFPLYRSEQTRARARAFTFIPSFSLLIPFSFSSTSPSFFSRLTRSSAFPSLFSNLARIYR